MIASFDDTYFPRNINKETAVSVKVYHVRWRWQNDHSLCNFPLLHAFLEFWWLRVHWSSPQTGCHQSVQVLSSCNFLFFFSFWLPLVGHPSHLITPQHVRQSWALIEPVLIYNLQYWRVGSSQQCPSVANHFVKSFEIYIFCTTACLWVLSFIIWWIDQTQNCNRFTVFKCFLHILHSLFADVVVAHMSYMEMLQTW